MSADSISGLYGRIPHVFDPIVVPGGWLDNYDVVDVMDPGGWPVGLDPESTEAPPDTLDDSFGDCGPATPPEPPQDLIDVAGGPWPGGLAGLPPPDFQPPSDCLAFYLPFHQFYPKWWGIYLLAPGVDWFTEDLQRKVAGQLTDAECQVAARMYLYFHEAYHHNVECFASRLEVSHRTCAYLSGFSAFFNKGRGTDQWLEEGLAEAHALHSVMWRTKLRGQRKMALKNALKQQILNSPPGYRMGVDWSGAARSPVQAKLSEGSHALSFPHVPPMPSSIWEDSATFMVRGYTTIKSRVKYLVPKGHPLSGRLPLYL